MQPLPPRRALEIACELLRAVDGTSSTDPEVERRLAALAEPAYAAPEAGTSKGPRVTVYAVGAMLYELLVGRPPFIADDPEALKRMHLYAPLQPLAQRVSGQTFSDAIEAIVATALAKVPGRRYQTTAEMLETIEHVLKSLGDDVAPAPVVAPPPVTEIDPDDSLLQYAEELKRHRPPPLPSSAVDVPPVLDNASRIVPQTPWPQRIVERVPTKLRWPIAAGVGVVLLVIVIAKCSGGGDDKTPATSTVIQPTTGTVVDDDAGAAPAPVDLEVRCEQLAKACGDQDKHRSKLTAACQLEAQVIVEKQCADVALGAYDCYERDLCGKEDKVWALADLDVLSDRRGKCVSERAALIMCLAK